MRSDVVGSDDLGGRVVRLELVRHDPTEVERMRLAGIRSHGWHLGLVYLQRRTRGQTISIEIQPFATHDYSFSVAMLSKG